MDSIQLLLLSVLLFVLAAVLSLLLRRSSQAARYTSGVLGMIASIAGCLAALQIFVSGAATLELSGSSALGNFPLRVDAFSAFMIGMISVLAFATSLYSISYVQEYDDRGLGGTVRVEDDIVVTDSGSRVLGKAIPIEMEDVEALAG